ncbi:hypothetical protein RA178_06245 [Shewanella oncorhynchi]|uniref:Uncharacterized protein n=1 Tax=Shewanella oncorhynchi TaxID=2726434 RepID=A0AA50Q6V1_9GAMM|nr:hypothetical protein [Shewanella oncorhynchi]WMB74212.1 hypothetical protein RA178_06245 [Shewanella oncorhynchi]
MDKECHYRTYLSLISHPTKGTLVYGGLHKSTYENPNEDPYKGSGLYILRFMKKYGKDLVSMRWVGEHNSVEEMVEAEIELIANLRKTYGDKCVNIKSGGQFHIQPSTTEEISKKISDSLKEYNKNLCSLKKEQLRLKTSIIGRRRAHWNQYSKLYQLWVSEGMPKAGRFRRIASEASYPDVNYVRMVDCFIKDAGTNYKPVPYDFKCRANRTQKGEHWLYYEPLYEVWVKNNKPKYPTFKHIATYLGYPSAYYRTMVEHFKTN